MIQNQQELENTLERIGYFQQQVEKLGQMESNSQNFRLSAGGFLAEIAQMNVEVSEYLGLHPSEIKVTDSPNLF